MTSKERIAEIYLEVLCARMGLDAEFDGERVLLAPVPGVMAAVELYERDPEYLHLVLPMGGSTGMEAAALDRICAETARKCKGAKARTDGDGDLLFTVEMLVAAPDCLPAPDHLQAVLPRALSMLMHAVATTVTEIEFARLVGTAGDGGAG